MVSSILPKEPFVTMEHDGLHVSPGDQPITVDIGVGQTVEIDKLFGPLIFAPIRVRADFASTQWVVERQRIDSMEWIEVARIDGQFDYEFDEAHPEHREIPA